MQYRRRPRMANRRMTATIWWAVAEQGKDPSEHVKIRKETVGVKKRKGSWDGSTHHLPGSEWWARRTTKPYISHPVARRGSSIFCDPNARDEKGTLWLLTYIEPRWSPEACRGQKLLEREWKGMRPNFKRVFPFKFVCKQSFYIILIFVVSSNPFFDIFFHLLFQLLCSISWTLCVRGTKFVH